MLGDGTLNGKTWKGNVVLKGYGDPTLSAADLRSLARQVARDGITRVHGRVVGDESWFDARRVGAGWRREFYLNESPALSALVVDRGWDGRAEREPALYAAQLFRRYLVDAGVSVSGPPTTGVARASATVLGWVRSPPVASLVRFMDTESDNFTAEMLLKQVGAVQLGAGTAGAGAAEMRALLVAAGIPLRGVRMVDGSGLSVLNRWTAAGLGNLLRRMWLDPDLRPYITTSLPIAGVTGTLVYRMRTGPARGLVRAKTGTTAEASALSGFVGRRYVFSVIENGSPVKVRAAHADAGRVRTGARARCPRRLLNAAAEQSEQVGLGEDRHAPPSAPSSASTPRLLADDEAGRLRRDRVGDLRAERLERGLRLVAGETLERARDDVRLAGKRALLRPLLLSGLEAQPELAQLLDESAVLLVGEPVDNVLGPVRAEALDLGDLLRGRRHEPVDRAEVAGEVAREHPADAREC